MNAQVKYSRMLRTAAVLIMLVLLAAACKTPDQGVSKNTYFPISVGPNASANRTGVFYFDAGIGSYLRQKRSYSAQKSNTYGQIHLIMVGDMLMHDPVLSSGRQEDGTYNYDGLFVHVADYVRQTDLAIVNQETILGGTQMGLSGYPNFNSPWELGDSEIKSGFNIILHATNHAYDMGKIGILNTISFWEENYPDIPYLGINASSEHQNDYLCIYEKDDIRIAILNYTYGTNGGRIAGENEYLIDYMDEDKVISDIKRAREVADFVVVCPHWGTEYCLSEDDYQNRWTEIFLENGVDLVIGAHPHVIQPIRWIRDEDGHAMLVYYSLGNYINGTNESGSGVLQRIIGGMADVTIGRDEEGKVSILNYGVKPLICHYDNAGRYTTYFLADYTEDLLQENGYSSRIPDLSLDRCQDYVHQVWGADAE